MEKILMIDDDAKLMELVSEYLQEYGFSVLHHEDGSGVLEKINAEDPDLILLDVMLPVKNGIDVLHEIREKSEVPVIMLTAKGGETERIVGLELGADDYIAKPFSSRELLARIKSVLRRCIVERENTSPYRLEHKKLICGNFVLNPKTFTLEYEEKKTALSRTEYNIMKFLMSNPNTVLSRETILKKAQDRDFVSFGRSIDVQISRLRTKVENLCGEKERIRTIRGIGYMFIL